jgi:fructokinase
MAYTTLAKTLVPGSVLLDIYLDSGQQYLGGAEFNFAYHLHFLLGSVDFLGRIGSDKEGKYIWYELARRKFPYQYIQVDPEKRTKTVQVQKNRNNEPAFIIPTNVASEFLEYPPLSDDRLAAYELVYFGTTLQHGLKSRQTLRSLLSKSQGTKFCDLNLRPQKYTPETIEYSLRTCNFLKINHEELDVISDLFHFSGGREEKVLYIAQKFKISSICVTMAERGSIFYQSGNFSKRSISTSKIIDTVGAGDGFSACLVIGLLQGWSPIQTLEFASDFAGAICQLQGALPTRPEFYSAWKSRMNTMSLSN